MSRSSPTSATRRRRTGTRSCVLAEQMVADGQTPFCLGIESGGASGWPATDWVEQVVLRTAGADFYDDWIDHRVPFDDPSVVKRFARSARWSCRQDFSTPLLPRRRSDPSPSRCRTSSASQGVPDDAVPQLLAGDSRRARGRRFRDIRVPDLRAGPRRRGGRWRRDCRGGDRPSGGSPSDGRARITGHGRCNGGVPWPVGLPANARFDTAKIVNPVHGRDRRELAGGYPVGRVALRRIGRDADPRSGRAPSSPGCCGCSWKERPRTSMSCRSTSLARSKRRGSNSNNPADQPELQPEGLRVG